ncbi:MAG: anthranilate phosphoribosyltransferase [Candidatus Magasanikbacteria bacterium CG_4_10_14_0_2_um_filter_37_12]|uniref:Anthranilate phosphoribosyltransferase n=1 Tax=Candidatus Magasanikbacteria bacterium CG_4_10_14_0_2_um_filter_37_12 TaxID=1974637 RepID=A0A2M7V6T1_9BACT|nr:MAG: anthranilate phosphoribosyltransferase [Candidatus Magasanikbacteria bacterium CG_4_10_14_0_2_um_filter_37_12]
MKYYLKKITDRENLTEEESYQAMNIIANGEADNVETGAFLTALAMKGETIDEMVGMVRAMREHMVSVDIDYDTLDTCGTGGDGANTINISTMVAFVCAVAGVKVAKHGNRSVSSKCGSFDVLEKLGVRIDLQPKQAKQCLDQVGVACLFTPNFHPAMKHVVPVRKALGIRTVFNFMGPLLNPVNVTHQLIGVSSRNMAEKLGEIMIKLGSKKVILVNSDDGLDEISIAMPTKVYEFVQGRQMKEYKIESDKKYSLDGIRGGNVEENAILMKNILAGNGTEAHNECIAMNAGMALLASGVVETFEEGKSKAMEILKSGKVLEKFGQLVEFTQDV